MGTDPLLDEEPKKEAPIRRECRCVRPVECDCGVDRHCGYCAKVIRDTVARVA